MTPEEFQQYLASLRTGGVPTDVGIIPPRVPLGVSVPVPAPQPQAAIPPQLTGADLDMARAQQVMAQQGWLSGQHLYDPPSTPSIPARLSPAYSSELLARITGGVGVAPVPGVSADIGDHNRFPGSAVATPGIDWASQRGVGGALRAAGGRGSVPATIGDLNLTSDQLAKLADQIQANDDANRQNALQAARGMVAPTALNRTQAAADLESKSPMSQDTSYYRRLAANLPFWSDKLNGMDFSGARDHAMAVDKEERGALSAALKMRQEGIDRKMGYMAGDNTDQNTLTKFQNAQRASESAAGNLSSDALKFRGQGIENMAQRKTQMDIARMHEAGANGRADRANVNPLAVLAQNLGDEVRAGRMTNDEATARYKLESAGKQPATHQTPLSATEATWIDSTAQSLLGKNISTPKGQELYLKFRMAASIPGMQTAAQKALYDDIHSTKW